MRSHCLILLKQGLSLCLAIDCQVATPSEPLIDAGVAGAHVMSGFLCECWELNLGSHVCGSKCCVP